MSVFQDVQRFQSARRRVQTEHPKDHARRIEVLARRHIPESQSLTTAEIDEIERGIPQEYGRDGLAVLRRQVAVQKAQKTALAAKRQAAIKSLPADLAAPLQTDQYIEIRDEWDWRAHGLVWPDDGIAYRVRPYTIGSRSGWELWSEREITSGPDRGLTERRIQAVGPAAEQRSQPWTTIRPTPSGPSSPEPAT